MPKRDAIAILKEDHRKVRQLLEELASTTARSGKRREKLFHEIMGEIQTHSKLEEEIFYPAYREAVRSKEDKKLFFEATEEHHIVDVVLEEIQQTEWESDEFAAKAKVLKDLVEHHIKEEEREMFPTAKEHMDPEQLQELGQMIEERKPSLQEEFTAVR